MNDDTRYGENRSPESITDSLSESELDTLIDRFGSDYNRPTGFVPREEMWQEIQRHGSREPVRRWPSISLMAAAVVLLAAGIGIGAELHSRGIVGSGDASLASGANHAPAPHVASSTPLRNSSGNRDGVSPATRAPVKSGMSAPRPLPSGAFASSNVGSTQNDAARSTAYSLATVRHFTAVEALLTSYQTTQRDANNDAQLAAWARSLLSQTRLLLDSPAATDPMRNKLLQDLELILVQMTQLSPANTSIDRESLDGSMKHSAVITRLRTAVPAGASTTL